MGQASSQETYNEEELLQQLKEQDPTFCYNDYVGGNCTLQEVIGIRQCFLDLRADQESSPEDGILLCGGTDVAADPPETVAARKLRSLPFLTNEDIMQASMAAPASQELNEVSADDGLDH